MARPRTYNIRLTEEEIKELKTVIRKFDEYGDEQPVNRRFTVDRKNCVLTMTNFDADSTEQSVTLESRKVSTLLRRTVHSLEIFMWQEDYGLSPDRTDPYLPVDPEDWDEDFEEEEADDPALEIEASWRVQSEYADHTQQEIVSYEDYLPDRPEELYFALLDYFEPDTEIFEGED